MRHAILIASATFDSDSGIEPLRFPADDVAALDDLFRTDDFKFDIVTPIIDKPKQFVEEQLDKILSESSYGDFILIYFSGHGKLNAKGDLFLSCRNTKDRTLNATGFKYKSLMDMLDAHSAERVAIMLDCCYAGRAVSGLRGSVAEQVNSQLDSGRGIFILGASGATQTAEEREADGNGIFTKQVIKGLQTGEADIDGDGEISLSDLANYVRHEFRRQKIPQDPTVANYSRSGEFILGTNRKLKHKRLIESINAKIEQNKAVFQKTTRRAIEDYLDQISDKPGVGDDPRFKALASFAVGGAIEEIIIAFRHYDQLNRPLIDIGPKHETFPARKGPPIKQFHAPPERAAASVRRHGYETAIPTPGPVVVSSDSLNKSEATPQAPTVFQIGYVFVFLAAFLVWGNHAARNAPLAVLLSVFVLFLALSFPTFRRRTSNYVDVFMRGASTNAGLAVRLVLVFIGLCVVIFPLAAAIVVAWPLLEGASGLRTILFRLAVLALCIWLIFHGWQSLDKNMHKIARDLYLVEMWQRVKAEKYDVIRKVPPWIRFASVFWYRLPADDCAIDGDGKRLQTSALRFWRSYIYQGHWAARFIRIAGGVVAMFGFSLLLVDAFAVSPPPTRGDVSFLAYEWIGVVLFVATLFLFFFVADTTLLCWRIVEALRVETAVWPAKTLEEFSHRLALPKYVLNDWIDLVFVSEHSRCITTFIYYPFLILALQVVSLSRLFADYAPSVPILIVTGLSVLIVVACAVALHWSAEASRAQARLRLKDEIVKAKNSKDGGRLAGQLEMLFRYVEELREGAFSPFLLQPVVRAMLLPVGGFGGMTLLEHLPGLS